MMFPLFVDVSAKRIVVFGGGAVAERKVSRLLDAGAKEVEVYSLDFVKELEERCRRGEVKCRRCDLWSQSIEEIVEGAFLVLICTDDDALNEFIFECVSAKAPNTLVNYAQKGDVFFPAIVRKGDFTIAISTDGKSPAMARFVKQKVLNALCGEDENMLLLLSWLRGHLKEAVSDEKRRREILNAVLSSVVCWEFVRTEPFEDAKRRISAFVEDLLSEKRVKEAE
ncbi:MAG: Siroheme synthase [Methanophagales archaeon]|nr:bifunctional precorrin-2 dehydrogenase/sirohydrochlorin ferrochelatase [Methanophagales archaeon]MCU4139902.1 Siroheme synthase [Methanophagales archaeon]